MIPSLAPTTSLLRATSHYMRNSTTDPQEFYYQLRSHAVPLPLYLSSPFPPVQIRWVLASHHSFLGKTPRLKIDPSPCPAMMESNIWQASARLVWGTWWDAPLKVMKMTPEKTCSKPECCPSVNQGLLNRYKYYYVQTSCRLSLRMPLRVSTQGTTASQLPLQRMMEMLREVGISESRYLYEAMDPEGSMWYVMSSAQGPFHFCPLNLALKAQSLRWKQSWMPSKNAQGAPLNLPMGGAGPGDNCFFNLLRMVSWVINFFLSFCWPLPLRSKESLQQQYPQTLQGFSSSVPLLYSISKKRHPAELGSVWQDDWQMETISGSTNLRSIMYSQVLRWRVSKLITPLPTKMETKLMAVPSPRWFH